MEKIFALCYNGNVNRLFLLIFLFSSFFLSGCLSNKNFFFKKVEPLSEEKIDSIIKDSQLGFYPITIEGKPDKIVSDMNGDGIKDFIVLYISTNSSTTTEKSQLSGKNRIHNSNYPANEFCLISFANIKNNHIEKKSTLFLGSYKTIQNITTLKERTKESDPMILEISFADKNINTSKVVFFRGFDIASTFEMKNDACSGYYLKDIDQDSIPEIIKYHSHKIKNRYNDTVLSLYQWDGSFFKFTQSFLIVKELKAYLNQIQNCVEKNDTEELILKLFPPLEAQKFLSQKLTSLEATKKVFKPADSQTQSLKKPKNIFFSEIPENPFTLQNQKGEKKFKLFCRIIFTNRTSDFYVTNIILNENPFSDKPFYFSYQ